MKSIMTAGLLGIFMLSTALTALAAGSNTWPMYNGDSTGSRYNANEKKLSTSNVASLGVLWQYNTATVVTGTPVVSDGMVFAAEAGGGGGFGGSGGTIYALNVNNGAVIWKTTIPDSTFTATA